MNDTTNAPPQKFSVDQFADLVKSKYPYYSSIDNTTLVQKILHQYPQYGQHVQPPEPVDTSKATIEPGNLITGPTFDKGGFFGGLARTPVAFGVGAGAEIGKGFAGILSAASRGIGMIAGITGGKKGQQVWQNAAGDVDAASKAMYGGPLKQMQEARPLTTIAGQLSGQAAMLAAPTKAVAAGKEAISPIGEAVASKIGNVAAYPIQKILNALPEAAVGFGYGLSQGQSTKGAATTAGVFGGLSSLGEVIGDTFRAFQGGLADNVGKALGFTNKMSLSTATEKVPQSIRALKTVANLSEDMKVVDANGIEKQFVPSESTWGEMVQALKQSKDKIYEAYTALAGQASDSGAQFTEDDFSQVEDALKTYTKDSTGTFRSKADSIIKDMQNNFGTPIEDEEGNVTYQYKQTELPRIQKFLESVNTDVNPNSDKAGAEVSGVTSRELRKILDGKIEAATGEQYQQLRSSYADLKSIENDTVNQFKKSARQMGGVLGQYVEGFGTIDVLDSLARGDAIGAGRGLTYIGLAKLIRHLRDPEGALQRAFMDIQDISPSPTSARIFGGV